MFIAYYTPKEGGRDGGGTMELCVHSRIVQLSNGSCVVTVLLTITATTSSSSSITLHPSRYTKQAARYGDMDHHQLTGHRVHGIDY